MSGQSPERLAGDQEVEDLWKIPSQHKELLRGMIGRRILALTRYSWFPIEKLELDFDVAPEDAFSLTEGPLAIELDPGDIVAFMSLDSANSVMVWQEATAKRYTCPDPMSTDEELFPLHASDERFRGPWRRLEGATIKSIAVMKREPPTVRYYRLPNEVGVRFYLDNGLDFIASHGLADNSYDFCVITESQILPEIRPHLSEIDIMKI